MDEKQLLERLGALATHDGTGIDPDIVLRRHRAVQRRRVATLVAVLVALALVVATVVLVRHREPTRPTIDIADSPTPTATSSSSAAATTTTAPTVTAHTPTDATPTPQASASLPTAGTTPVPASASAPPASRFCEAAWPQQWNQALTDHETPVQVVGHAGKGAYAVVDDELRWYPDGPQAGRYTAVTSRRTANYVVAGPWIVYTVEGGSTPDRPLRAWQPGVAEPVQIGAIANDNGGLGGVTRIAASGRHVYYSQLTPGSVWDVSIYHADLAAKNPTATELVRGVSPEFDVAGPDSLLVLTADRAPVLVDATTGALLATPASLTRLAPLRDVRVSGELVALVRSRDFRWVDVYAADLTAGTSELVVSTDLRTPDGSNLPPVTISIAGRYIGYGLLNDKSWVADVVTRRKVAVSADTKQVVGGFSQGRLWSYEPFSSVPVEDLPPIGPCR